MDKYLLIDGDSGITETIEAADEQAAIEQGREWAKTGYDEIEETAWIQFRLVKLADVPEGEEPEDQLEQPYGCMTKHTVALDPREPRCAEKGQEHDWQSPHSLVGGAKDDPGVYGHGGGAKIYEACLRCGCGRLTDTWAQDPSSGRQGLRSVKYTPEEYEIPDADSTDESED